MQVQLPSQQTDTFEDPYPRPAPAALARSTPVRLDGQTALDTLISHQLNLHHAAESIKVTPDELVRALPKDENARLAIENAAKLFGVLEAFDIVRSLLMGLQEKLEDAEPGDYVKGLSAATTALNNMMTAAKDTASITPVAPSQTNVTVNVVDKLLAEMSPQARDVAQVLLRPPKQLAVPSEE